MEALPVADPQVVQATQKEYLKLQREDNKEARDARFRWLPLLSCPLCNETIGICVSCPALLLSQGICVGSVEALLQVCLGSGAQPGPGAQ